MFRLLEEEQFKCCIKSVDIADIAKQINQSNRGRQYRFPGANHERKRIRMVYDTDSGIHRLYGNYGCDYVCGGEWRKMINFVSFLMQTCDSSNIDLVFFVNGAVESGKVNMWSENQLERKKNTNGILSHIEKRSTPPPGFWWQEPSGIRSCLMTFLTACSASVVVTKMDHNCELSTFCQRSDVYGLIADHADFFYFDLTLKYYSASNLKLYQHKIATVQYCPDTIREQLNLTADQYVILGVLLGNHILSLKHLQNFHSSLQIGSTTQEKDKILLLATFVRDFEGSGSDLAESIAKQIFRNNPFLVERFTQSYKYYSQATPTVVKNLNVTQHAENAVPAHLKQAQQADDINDSRNQTWLLQQGSGYNLQTPNKGDTDSPKHVSVTKNQNPTVVGEHQSGISQDVMRVAESRHERGLMCPWVYQVLSEGIIKLPVILESYLPDSLCSVVFYRPIRQRVYAVLLDMKKRLVLNQVNEGSPQLQVREYYIPKLPVTNKSPTQTAHHDCVDAIMPRCTLPSLEQLWFSEHPEARRQRLSVFVACMNCASATLLFDSTYVQKPLLLFCCVLRYILGSTETRILSSLELDAVLATMVSPKLQDEKECDIELTVMCARGVELAAVLMRGLEMALFVNDACGAPIPKPMCQLWDCFSGKLFHYKLMQAMKHLPLIEICDNQLIQKYHVERLHQAVMEGYTTKSFRTPFMTSSGRGRLIERSLPNRDEIWCGPPEIRHQIRTRGAANSPKRGGIVHPPPMMGPRHGMRGPRGRAMGPPGRMMLAPGRGGMRGYLPPPLILPGHRRGRGMRPPRHHMDTRGGQLEIAGVVVGEWDGNNDPLNCLLYDDGGDYPNPHKHRQPPIVASVVPGSERGGRHGRGLHQHNQRRQYVSAESFYGKQKSKRGAMRGRGKGQQSNANNGESKSMGRGCTVECGDGDVLLLSDIMQGTVNLDHETAALSPSDKPVDEMTVKLQDMQEQFVDVCDLLEASPSTDAATASTDLFTSADAPSPSMQYNSEDPSGLGELQPVTAHSVSTTTTIMDIASTNGAGAGHQLDNDAAVDAAALALSQLCKGDILDSAELDISALLQASHIDDTAAVLATE